MSVAPVLDHLLDRIGANAVILLYGLLNALPGGKRRLDGPAGYEPKPVGGLCIERIARNDGQNPIGDSER